MLSQSRYRLTLRQGPTPGKVFDLPKDTFTIGRDVNADVTINDPEVSRTHIRFTAQADGYLIEDLGSTNGTFINGQRVSGTKLLRPGDTLGLGETVVLELSRAGDPAATVVMPAKSMPTDFHTPPPPPPGPATATIPPVYEPAATSSAPAQGNPALKWIAIGCGCLTLFFLCLGVTVLAAYLMNGGLSF